MGNAQAGISDSNFGPNTLKTSAELVSSVGLNCGVSSMQGWRPEMEVSNIFISFRLVAPSILIIMLLSG